MTTIDKIIDGYGDIKNVMANLDLQDPQAVYNWRRRGIPYSKIQQIHKDTGIPLEELLSRDSADP